MKRIKETITEVMLVLAFLFGLILCMCETSDISDQVCVSLAGIAVMAIAALLFLYRAGRERWQMN